MKKYRKPYCKYCKDIPLFGCVACPTTSVASRARKMISQLDDEDEVYRSEQVAEILKELIR